MDKETSSKLSDFLKALSLSNLLMDSIITEDKQVNGITYNSKTVKRGSIFVCKGKSFKREYLIEAVNNGAIAYVSEEDYNAPIPFIKVTDIRKAMPVMGKVFFGKPYDKLKVVGITGTKGKTTTLIFLKNIIDNYLSSFGKKTAYSSTIGNYNGIENEIAINTTGESFELFNNLNKAVKATSPYFLMEVSSQALKYRRADLINFEIGAFLNLGIDHISDAEHENFEDYFKSKLKIFSQSRRALINMDSNYIDEIVDAAKVCNDVVFFSTHNEKANVYAKNSISKNGNTEFDVVIHNIKGYSYQAGHITLKIMGMFNIQNALAAIALGAMLNIPFENIINGLSIADVPGRMELIYSKDNKKMGIVDFAHNSISYDALFSAITYEYPNRKIILCAGSKGNKAYSRRRIIAEFTDKYCSHIIITEDDFNNEDVYSICNEIASYLKVCKSYDIIPNREDAIKAAVKMASDDNIIVIVGRGIKKLMVRNGKNEFERSDTEIMREEMSKI